MMHILRILIVIYFIKSSWAGDENQDPDSISPHVRNLENIISNIESLTLQAEKSRLEGILPIEETNKLLNSIAKSMAALTEMISAKNNTYAFFKLNAVDRILIPNIRSVYLPLRGQFLILIKTLFSTAPTTSRNLLPINIVDMLLDVFENDDDLALKAHALDILYEWLPNSPKLQARVMKLKGLEPFYNQISKLDTDVVLKLLDLFNTILEEHLQARNKDQRNRGDFENYKLYQMIGLVERMSTGTVCNGLLNIFKATTAFSDNNEEILAPVFKLMKNIKPYCIELYLGKSSAVEVFADITKYIKDNEDIDFKGLGLNITEIKMILNDYNQQLREYFKDEL
ncbi:unnamed protein product [Leptosia nina]|uniref:Uncharacterized protein n=1 Tax=Leptosia nina TaxID=320188 RepID=A0AAV1IW86_9NEOP